MGLSKPAAPDDFHTPLGAQAINNTSIALSARLLPQVP